MPVYGDNGDYSTIDIHNDYRYHTNNSDYGNDYKEYGYVITSVDNNDIHHQSLGSLS